MIMCINHNHNNDNISNNNDNMIPSSPSPREEDDGCSWARRMLWPLGSRRINVTQTDEMWLEIDSKQTKID